MKVRNKVIVVTGAGSGIGRELTLHLVAKGASIASVDVNPAVLEETASFANESRLHEGVVVDQGFEYASKS